MLSKKLENRKNRFFGIDAQRGNVGVSFLLFFKNMVYVSFDGRLSFPLFS